ncbi:MAG: sodium:solute symporter [Candidatus Omnitrophica bacterium 4484_49]|nr:MAG: sodium:solute symporter [Candidatus Omnitrophica bacterium 4484_49]
MIFNIFVVAIYFMFLLWIGVKSSRRIISAQDYIIAGRDLGFWVFVLLIIGSTASGMTLLGVAGLGYIGGYPTFWEQIFVPLSCALTILLFGTKLHRIARKRNYLTLEDYFSDRFYSNKSMRLLSSIVVLTVSLVYLVGQYTAISIVLTWLLKISHAQALVITAVIVMSYVLLGGLYAVAFTTLVQAVMIILGVVIVGPMIIAKAGGLTVINHTLAQIDPNLIKPFFPQVHPPYAKYAFCTPLFVISFALLLSLGLASAPHIINNVLAARRDKYFKWAPLAAFSIYLVVMYLIKLSGFAVRALAEKGVIHVARPDFAFIAGVEYVLPKGFWVFFGTVILAAVMSTTDRLMLTIGNCVSWNIYKKFINKQASDKSVNIVNRITIITTAIITVILAIKPPRLLALLIWMGIGIMFSSFVVPLIAGLYWRKATKEAAILSMALGFVSAIAFALVHKFYKPLPMHFSFFSFLFSLFIMIIVSQITPAPSEKTLDETETGFFIKERQY